MIKSYENLHSFIGHSKFSTWLLSIASRLYIDQIRKQKREANWMNHTKIALSGQLTWKAKTKGIERSDTFTDFNNLDAELRIPILLHHYYGYTSLKKSANC
jgi:RNA polymerase sigma-70 factor, ECF subfamily